MKKGKGLCWSTWWFLQESSWKRIVQGSQLKAASTSLCSVSVASAVNLETSLKLSPLKRTVHLYHPSHVLQDCENRNILLKHVQGVSVWAPPWRTSSRQLIRLLSYTFPVPPSLPLYKSIFLLQHCFPWLPERAKMSLAVRWIQEQDKINKM